MAFVSIFSAKMQVSLQPKELSLDEATILRRGCLKFRMCNAGTIKYGVLVRMVCEVVSGYVCKKKIHIAERQNLEDTFFTFSQKLRPKSSHLSSHFYNSVRSAETFLDRKARVCGITRTNKGYST
jgi:hypothetical protein